MKRIPIELFFLTGLFFVNSFVLGMLSHLELMIGSNLSIFGMILCGIQKKMEAKE